MSIFSFHWSRKSGELNKHVISLEMNLIWMGRHCKLLVLTLIKWNCYTITCKQHTTCIRTHSRDSYTVHSIQVFKSFYFLSVFSIFFTQCSKYDFVHGPLLQLLHTYYKTITKKKLREIEDTKIWNVSWCISPEVPSFESHRISKGEIIGLNAFFRLLIKGFLGVKGQKNVLNIDGNLQLQQLKIEYTRNTHTHSFPPSRNSSDYLFYVTIIVNSCNVTNNVYGKSQPKVFAQQINGPEHCWWCLLTQLKYWFIKFARSVQKIYTDSLSDRRT